MRLYAIGLSVVLGLSTMTACGTDQPAPVEQGDCDFDDVLERDTDCGFSKKKTKKPAVKAPARKSKPKSRSTTRRK